jgi:hypothetical protein
MKRIQATLPIIISTVILAFLVHDASANVLHIT